MIWVEMVGFLPPADLLISSQLTPQPSSLSQHCSPLVSVLVISLSKAGIILLREDWLPQWEFGCFSLSLCFLFWWFVGFCCGFSIFSFKEIILISDYILVTQTAYLPMEEFFDTKGPKTQFGHAALTHNVTNTAIYSMHLSATSSIPF